ncbi:CTD small phosphatase-like protein 2-A [Polyodon spathula]|uniref:CTD small phosphatase-like protein 2-A n=1 Tax=Polyodon spathula TaxID=7913 RepID=UPI001B7EF158|nr:CTD small phosphatase-like protein 2-A [Polyodon spathula]
MLLRSRKIQARQPRQPTKEPTTPRTPRRSTESHSKTPRSTKRGRKASKDDDDVLAGPVWQDCEDIAQSAKKGGTMQTRSRLKAEKEEDDNEEFKTPLRGRRLQVRFEMNEDSPRNAVRKIYSPIARFLSLSQGDDKTPWRQRTKTRNQNRGEMESNCFSPVLGNEEDNEVFNPYTFIQNIPSQVGQYKIRDIPLKTRRIPESTLVLDLEETLVYSSLNVIENAEHTFLTHFQDQQYKVYMNVRPYVQEFLERMSKVYEIFVYTSAKREYADEILDLVDPQKKLVRHRLYQEDCFCVQGHYIKDLTVLKRDLAKAVIVGNTPYTFPYQLMNMIPIPSWYGNKADQELQKLIPDLEKLSETDDFQVVLKRRADQLHRLLSED